MIEIKTAILYIISFVILISIASALLKKWAPISKLKGGPGIALFFIIIIATLFKPIVEIIGFSTPFIALIVVTIALMILVFAVSGIPTTRIKEVLTFPTTKNYIKLIILLILCLGAAKVFGQQLLDDQSISITGRSVSFADAFLPAESSNNKIDLSAAFTTQAIGSIFFFAVMGLSFTVVGIWMQK
ncbi:hypothetical protein HN587_03935 [Candidatus Woesearchaeota archaeon]|nr:hypothetical protein [Candidatus Woesearchaeota archaeon]